jgi:hypothetical protein
MDVFNSENEILNNSLYLPKHPAKRASFQQDQSRRRILKGQAAKEFISDQQKDLIDDFTYRRSRSRFEKRATFSGGGDVFAALPRFYNPREYFEMSQIPYDIKDDKQRIELYKWLNMFYMTHYLIPSLVDIFTRFPLNRARIKV